MFFPSCLASVSALSRSIRRCPIVALALGLVWLAALGAAAAGEPFPTPPPGSPVAIHGQLATRGNAIVSEYGVPVQLRGVCLHGLQWFGDFYRDGRAIDAAATAWGADVVRIAVYLHEGGYLENTTLSPDDFDALIDSIVRRCVERGIYCVIDWHVHHPGDPLPFVKQARQFFDTTAARYAGLPNVIYEIANEPNRTGLPGVAPERDVHWHDIVTYADEVIPVIRRRSPESLVLVGTPDWSSFGINAGRDWRDVVDHPLDFENVAYVVHAYAAGHSFHAIVDRIAEKVPLFVTEWSAATWDRASGNDLVKAQPWIEVFDRRGISWTYWNYCPGDGVFGMFRAGTTCDDNLAPGSSQVSETGRLVYMLLNTPRDRWHDESQSPGPPAVAAPSELSVPGSSSVINPDGDPEPKPSQDADHGS